MMTEEMKKIAMKAWRETLGFDESMYAVWEAAMQYQAQQGRAGEQPSCPGSGSKQIQRYRAEVGGDATVWPIVVPDDDGPLVYYHDHRNAVASVLNDVLNITAEEWKEFSVDTEYVPSTGRKARAFLMGYPDFKEWAAYRKSRLTSAPAKERVTPDIQCFNYGDTDQSVPPKEQP